MNPDERFAKNGAPAADDAALAKVGELPVPRWWHLRSSIIKADVDPQLARAFGRFSWAGLILALVIAFLGLLGWALTLPSLQSLLPGNPRMVPFTACALILACITQGALRLELRRGARVGGALVLTASCVALAERSGINLFPGGPFSPEGGGAVSILTLICLIFGATAELLLTREKTKTAWTAQLFSLFVMTLSGWNLLLYFYGSAWRTAIAYNSMAAPTSIALFCLAFSTMISKPYTGIMVLLTTRSLGGAVARRLLGATCAFPLAAGWLAVLVQSFGMADVTVASTALVCFTMLFFSGVLWITAAQIHRLSQDRDEFFTSVNSLKTEARLRDEFVAMLTHDLRNPLMAAKMGTDLALRSEGRPDIMRRSLERARHSIERADGMIRDLLDASRIRAGEALPLEVSECDLSAVLETTVEQLRFLHPRREIVLSYAGPVSGRWSCEGIRRILENLITNALKYGDASQPITCTCRPVSEGAELLVHNWGPVIPPEKLAGLFLPYRRDAAVEGKKPGWGLGLALVRGLAEAHGGSVRAESRPEVGTTFHVLLPRQAAENP